MRLIALDLGGKRTGVASGDGASGIVTPRVVVERPMDPGDDLLRELASIIRDEQPDAVVVGLPMNMDGSEGPQAASVRSFADRIGQSTGVPIVFHDERLTSVEADWQMAQSGLTHKQKKKLRDALAAAVILRDYLASTSAS